MLLYDQQSNENERILVFYYIIMLSYPTAVAVSKSWIREINFSFYTFKPKYKNLAPIRNHKNSQN